jgi:hypothetical protein
MKISRVGNEILKNAIFGPKWGWPRGGGGVEAKNFFHVEGIPKAPPPYSSLKSCMIMAHFCREKVLQVLKPKVPVYQRK